MRSVSLTAAARLLVLASVLAAPAAQAQRSSKRAVAEVPQGRAFALSKAERAAILPLQTAVEAGDVAAATAALPAARAAARSSDARYVVAQYHLRLAIAASDFTMQSDAMEALLASGGVPAADLFQIHVNQGALYANAGDLKKAEAAYARAAELAPNDGEGLALLGEIKNDLGNLPEAAALMGRSIALTEGAGQKVSEARYKRAVKIAYDARIAPESIAFSRGLAASYPSRENWRDAVFVHRDLAGLDAAALLDLGRLLRASKALGGERDYLELATNLQAAGYPAEAKAVLDEGIAAKMVDPAKGAFKALHTTAGKQATAARGALAGLQAKAASGSGADALKAADATYAQGDYTKAADLYRLAIGKGGVDADLANTRLGMALALAGKRAEAETALRAVTGTRGTLAALWLSWLGSRA